MINVNGVHALLALLAQGTGTAKQQQGPKVDVKQLEAILAESKALNQKLHSIELLLKGRETAEDAGSTNTRNVSNRNDGRWPTAETTHDMINRQQRQQAFGSWQVEKQQEFGNEGILFRAIEDNGHPMPELPSQVIERFTPTEQDFIRAELGVNYTAMGASRFQPISDEGLVDRLDGDDEKGRLLPLSIGIALLMFSLYAVLY